MTPSGIVDVGFMLPKQALKNSSVWSPVDSLIGVALSAGMLKTVPPLGIPNFLLPGKPIETVMASNSGHGQKPQTALF